MSVKRRLSGYAGMRIDWPHIRSIDSSVSNDFDDVLRGLVTGLNQPYLIRGFRIQIPTAAVPATSLQIEVADSAVLHSSATESGTILTVAAGEATQVLDSSNVRVSGSFQNGVINYVSLDYRRTTSDDTIDQTAGWSASQKVEFQRTAPIGRTLDYRFVINTTGFSTNLPLYIVKTTSTGAVESITKASGGLFRLGSGGAVPDANYSFAFRNLSNSSAPNPRQEWVSSNPNLNSMSVEPADPSSAFDYGDWSIRNLKEWMDAMMTRIKEVSGSQYWYMDTNSVTTGNYNAKDVWFDSGAGSALTGAGYLSYNFILESSNPTSGAFQSYYTDNTVGQGHSYVKGASSGVSASITSFNANQLVINSMTTGSFSYGETLYNRRKYYFNSTFNQLLDDVQGANRVANFSQKNVTPSGSQSVTSWSYTGTLVTLNVASTAGLSVGQSIFVLGLSCTSNAPNGVFMIKNLTATTITYSAMYAPTGATGGAATTGNTNQSKHPFLPSYSISQWSYVGANITVTAPNHNLTLGQTVVISGLQSTTNAPNGRYVLTSVLSSTFTFTAASTPTGTPTVASNAKVRYDSRTFNLTIEGADQPDYNKINVSCTALDDCNFTYIVDTSALPTISFATGPIEFDGIVAQSIVQDPVKVTYIQQVLGEIIVTTAVPHGLSAASSVSFIIFGDSQNSPYIRQYSNVDIIYVSTTQFKILNAGLAAYSDYNNTSQAQGTFVRFANNPYAGPIAWDQDIVIKSIVGDLRYTIPHAALAEGTPLANQFNTNGLTGTAYLQDGEVMYVELERNKSVTSGAYWSCGGGSSAIVGAQLPEDTLGSPLVAGDFVKFENETDAFWLRIDSIVTSLGTSSIYLKTDQDLSPDINQRPSKTGRLVYAKGTYSNVQVAQHHEVPSHPDVYWLGVRRDNGSLKSKVYFRALELEVGETRQVNDNEPSNLLIYTGAGNEAAINPNYTQIQASGPYQSTDTLSVDSIEQSTRIVVTNRSPELGWQIGDILEQGLNSFIVKHIVDGRTIVIKDSVASMVTGAITYRRNNYILEESDSLTLGLRKEDRDLGRINTALSRPIYDESFVVTRMTVSAGATQIQSGDYIYINSGNVNAPTALAWVLHGTANVNRTIENVSIVMPGGHVSMPANTILVALLEGSFSNGATLHQNGVSTGRTISDASAPTFTQPTIAGGTSNDGVEMVLPPNRRTQVKGGGAYIVWPQYSYYKSSIDPLLANEELMVVINDTIREAETDYHETYSGPRAKIRIRRDLPANTRIRCRTMTSFGSALTAKSGGVSLQIAYDGGNSIVTSGLLAPVYIDASNKSLGGASAMGQKLIGSLVLDGNYSGSIINGLFGPTDKQFIIGNESNKPKEAWSALQAVKSHSSHPASAAQTITGAGTSVGAGSYIIPSTNVTLAPNQTVRVEAKFTAKKQTGFAGATFRVEGCFYHDGTNVVQADSSLTELHGAYGEAIPNSVNIGYIASLQTSGTSILPTVYGVSDPVEWAVTMNWQIVGASS
jgi:hypothetical protein